MHARVVPVNQIEICLSSAGESPSRALCVPSVQPSHSLNLADENSLSACTVCAKKS